ncbi:MAG: hypothetical protein H6727_07590 [Myxococcales bacterium]|nr:hypothetical protein [Myxococcales bacterium]
MHDFSMWATLLVSGAVLAAFGGFVRVLWRVQQDHHALMEGLSSLANERRWKLELDGHDDCFFRLSGTWNDEHPWLIEGLREDVAIEGLRVTFPAPAGFSSSCLLVPHHQDAWAFDPSHRILPSALQAALGIEMDPKEMQYLSFETWGFSKSYLVLADHPALFSQSSEASALDKLLTPWLLRFSPDQLPLLAVHPTQVSLRFLVPVQDRESLLEILSLARGWFLFLRSSVVESSSDKQIND